MSRRGRLIEELKWWEVAYLAFCVLAFIALDVIVIVGVNGGFR